MFVKKEEKKLLVSEKKLLFVGATRIKGTSKKSQAEYDFANIEVSDGIGSLELPLEVHLAEILNRDLARGQEIKIRVDIRKQFGKSQFIVDEVLPVTK